MRISGRIAPLSVSLGVHHDGCSYGPMPIMFELFFLSSLRSATPKM